MSKNNNIFFNKRFIHFVTLLEFDLRQQKTISKNRKNYCNTSIIILVLYVV